MIEAGIDLLGQSGAGAFARDIVADGWVVDLQVEPGDEFLMDGAEARIDVVYVDRRCIGRLCFPKVSNCSGEESEHPAHSLEIRQSRGLAGEGVKNFRVKWIGPAKRINDLRLQGLGRDRIALGGPQRAVSVHRLGGKILIDGLKQAAAQDQDGLVIFGWVQQSGLAGRHALRLSHLFGQELVLLCIGVLCFAISANCQRVNQNRVRCAFDRLEESR